MRYIGIVLGMSICFSCAKEVAVPIETDFLVEAENDDYSVPVRVNIVNKTMGADLFNWSFEGGIPSTSNDKNPGTIIFNEPGEYTISLITSNRDGVNGKKDHQISIEEAIVPGFAIIREEDNYLPVTVEVENQTIGATTFHWTFEGGTPTTSDAEIPGKIVFNEPGEHRITLNAGNGRETQSITHTLMVAPDIVADFEYVAAFEDDDFQAPVTLTLVNKSTSATDFEWSFETAEPSFSIEINPTITLNNSGVHQLKLKASNSKKSHTVIKEITIFEDTNLRTFENIKLGISTAHSSNNIGALFSTVTRKVYTKDNMPSDDDSIVDIAFFALNQDFSFSKFISPDEVQEYTFEPILNATHTKFINLQESCECEASLSVVDFDTMEDDSLLSVMNIEETIGGIQDFDDTVVPRIVLFETWDKRRGAIKIKEFIQDGTNSHIVIDIKVQKQ